MVLHLCLLLLSPDIYDLVLDQVAVFEWLWYNCTLRINPCKHPQVVMGVAMPCEGSFLSVHTVSMHSMDGKVRSIISSEDKRKQG